MKHLISLASGDADAEDASDSISSVLDAYEARAIEEDVEEELLDVELVESLV
ncbi:hypothetical protein K4L44_15790 [Halosquirtibacter laminarini]|uniref:Uncharacterized protein n=1 Tax=Halosquirtibacter laminarini TaxID=3374600 RepID=A0AC61NN67_9BACT|nr:hypothetical protein K4L44_15790 [Prolixibacteraceae bacterium]